jgi:O-antigen ligase
MIGVSYSSEVFLGLSVLETNFGFAAIALLGARYKNLSSEKLKLIFSVFTIGVFCACSICLINACIRYYSSGNRDVFFFYEFTNLIGSHPTYLAYYIIFSITFVLNELSNNRTHSFGYLMPILLILFLFTILMLTGGRTAFISLLLVCSFFLLKSIIGENVFDRKVIAAVTILMILGMFLVSSLDKKTSDQQVSNDATWERLELWKAAINANTNFILGVGTGDYKIVLNKYYSDHSLGEYAKDNFNSHNQFLQLYFSNGILGLLAILFLIGRPLYLAIKNDHVFGILVFFSFLIYGMTEVFLGRYQGVVFFALLQQLFVSYYCHNKPSLLLKGVKNT